MERTSIPHWAHQSSLILRFTSPAPQWCTQRGQTEIRYVLPYIVSSWLSPHVLVILPDAHTTLNENLIGWCLKIMKRQIQPLTCHIIVSTATPCYSVNNYVCTSRWIRHHPVITINSGDSHLLNLNFMYVARESLTLCNGSLAWAWLSVFWHILGRY